MTTQQNIDQAAELLIEAIRDFCAEHRKPVDIPEDDNLQSISAHLVRVYDDLPARMREEHVEIDYGRDCDDDLLIILFNKDDESKSMIYKLPADVRARAIDDEMKDWSMPDDFHIENEWDVIHADEQRDEARQVTDGEIDYLNVLRRYLDSVHTHNVEVRNCNDDFICFA